jgi:hypothetical protein
LPNYLEFGEDQRNSNESNMTNVPKPRRNSFAGKEFLYPTVFFSENEFSGQR